MALYEMILVAAIFILAAVVTGQCVWYMLFHDIEE